MVLEVGNKEGFKTLVDLAAYKGSLSREKIVTEISLSALKENDHLYLGWGHRLKKWTFSIGLTVGCALGGFSAIGAAIYFGGPAMLAAVPGFVAGHLLGCGILAGSTGASCLGAYKFLDINIPKYVAKGLVYGAMLVLGLFAYKAGAHVIHCYDKKYEEHQVKMGKINKVIVKDLKEEYDKLAKFLRVRLQEVKVNEIELEEFQHQVAVVKDFVNGRLKKAYEKTAKVGELQFLQITKNFREVMSNILKAELEDVERSSVKIDSILTAAESFSSEELMRLEHGIRKISDERFNVAQVA